MTDAEVEAVARAIYEARIVNLKNCWNWDDPGLDEEHPYARKSVLRDARAAIAALDAVRGNRDAQLAAVVPTILDTMETAANEFGEPPNQDDIIATLRSYLPPDAQET